MRGCVYFRSYRTVAFANGRCTQPHSYCRQRTERAYFRIRYLRFRKLPTYADFLLRAIIGATAAAIVCTLGVNTFGLWLYYYSSTNYFAFTASRFIQLTSVAANVVLFAALIPLLMKIDLLGDAEKNRMLPDSENVIQDEQPEQK